MSADLSNQGALEGVAIVGMAGRFPGARSVADFWRNQLNGVEAISQFSVEELEVEGAAELARDPRYVRARSVLEDVDLFDAEFFGLYPREAELMDPQQRLFLECCWQTIEDAGYDPEAYTGQIGVFAGCSMGSYFLQRLCTRPDFIQQFTSGYQVSNYPEMMGNSLDFLSTRVSYKLNLRGPSFTMLSACSTSLLAVTQACQSLLTYQCDMALAGGASITFPQKRGYLHQDGGMVSKDGHCRAFDADAQGTVFGSGVATVLLKRVEDAVRDGDHIYAVIRGFAANNDGSAKVGYTAPSVDGQARVITMAQEAAGVLPESIGYIEAHGTGTPLGDPIELAGLAQAFGARASKTQFCTIGTAKTNVGHLDIAAGVTGLINATNIVRHGVFPPTLHFRKPNPNFDLAASPFMICATRSEWKSNGGPRRAGVSAFGVGGTNVHVVLEQAPEPPATQSARSIHLLVLSARSAEALDRASENLAAHLKEHPDAELADVAWTLQNGRRTFDCRRFVAAGNAAEAIAALAKPGANRTTTRSQPMEARAISFLFPGQGSQHPNMARQIYQSESVFRDALDRCAEILRPHLDADLRALLYPAEDVTEDAKRRVTHTVIAQPAIFSIEYALAKLWMSLGIRPQAMAGHSIGEFVVACLAGVFSLEDALALVAARGRMMQAVPAGGMLSVRMGDADVCRRLPASLSLAAINSPSLCVVAGSFEALDAFEQDLGREGVVCRRLVTSHAFHSAMMDPLTGPFEELFSRVTLNAPNIPYVSGVTGTWITDAEATSPKYWAQHARAPVQFSAAIKELRAKPSAVLLEVGPGNVLATLARQHSGFPVGQVIVSSLSDGFSGEGDAKSLANALGSLWQAGVQPDWPSLYSGEPRRRVSLPTYPFERKRYALDIPENTIANHSITALSPAPPPVGMTSSQIAIVSTPIQGTIPVNSMPSISPSAPVASMRPQRIRALLAEIFEGLSGQDISAVDGTVTFVEMGFDSLFLTQVTQALREKFDLTITFRQLLGDLSSLDALGAYVDEKLPPQAFAGTAEVTPSPSVAAAVPQALVAPLIANAVPTPAGAMESSVERLMREQLQAMNQLFSAQLATLGGGAPLAAPQAAQGTAHPIGPTPAVKLVAMSASPVAAPPQSGGAMAGLADPHKPFGPYKPPQTGGSVELLDRQAKSLERLIERYCRRTARSKQITQQHRKVLADPRVVSGFRPQWKEMVYPIVTDRSEGSRLWDVDGNEYIDLVNGFGPIMLGHRPKFLEDAIEAQLRVGFETGPQTPLAGEVAQMFCEMTGNERMTFCNTGSEAVLAAMRVARTVTGRSKIVTFSGDYHGICDEVLVKGFKIKSGAHQSTPIAPGIPRESVANMVVLDYATPESLEWIRQNANTLAAVLVEPVQSRHPDFQPVEFLREVRKITEKAETALIFDEVVTGFRVHPGGCQALFEIRADLATYGKVIAGGMPIGVLAGKSKFMDALDGGMWQYGDDSYPEVGVTFFAGTFVRHPLAVAATRAVLNHFKEQGPALQERLNARTLSLVGELKEFIVSHSIPARIESFGSFFYLSFPTEERFASLFYFYMREKGVHIREGFPCFLTTAHSDSDIANIIQAFKESATEMREGALFVAAAPPRPGTPLPPAPGASSTDLAGGAPLTESQLEVWLSDQLSEEASCSYNESFSLHMHGAVDEAALKRALEYLIGRHDALRANFAKEGDLQKFSSNLTLEIKTVDLTSLPNPEREEQFRHIIGDDAQTPFNLNEGPLVRAQLVKMESRYQILVFTSHHIVFDGWSANVLLDELSKTYNAAKKNVAWDLPEPVSFAAFANEQADFLQSPEGAQIESYWLDQFKIPTPLLDLPLDRSRPLLKQYEGATYRRNISGPTYSRIKSASAKLKCTLFVTLLAGFQILLSRLSGQDDVVVGIPTAGQSLLDNGTLVGHCVNFIPIRCQVDGSSTAAKFLSDVKHTVLAGYEHQNYAYGRLVRKLPLQRDPARLPLTEVQFNLERVGRGLNFDGLTVEVDPNPKSFVNFDIFLNVVESNDGLTLDCDYNTGLFDEATIARWLGHYEVLLEGIVADADRSISKLPLLSPAEKQQMLAEWNHPERVRLSDVCIHQLIETQTNCTPDSIAAIFEDKQFTYAELDRKANQLARYLRKLGVKPGVLVGVFVERSLEMVVALLGVLKAGGAYVPMDPTFPPARLDYVLGDAKASVVITQSTFTDAWSFGDARVVQIDTEWNKIDREEPSRPPNIAKPNDLAYVIYTSGSTGNPKGVEIQHHAVANLLVAMRSTPGLDPSDVFAAVTTLSFDIAGLELYLPLCVGATLAVVSRDTAQYGVQLLAYLQKIKATAMQATPVTWRQLIDAGWSGDPPLKVMCGGEAWSRQLADELSNRGRSVWNMYGPTETTIWSAVAQIDGGDGPICIGRPIANTQFYVLDKNLELVPTGVSGELHIAGDGLARGYLNRDQLTRERFISNPFSSEPGARMYRTGDLVRHRDDGLLEYLGRLDDQIKLRGFRIELGEIESALASHPGVDGAVVALREDKPGEKRLVGYLVPAAGIAPSSSELRSFLLTTLPAYMAPAAYIAIDSVPLTPNGKVDRRALPVPNWSERSRGVAYEAPVTPQEQEMARIWEEVLRLDQVGRNDNLFELGADSLHVFQIAARARKVGIEVSPRQILQHRTIAAVLAQSIKGDVIKKQAPQIRPVPREKFRVTSQVAQ